MANVDDLRNLRNDSGAITRGRHARRLRYKIMSARMDLISLALVDSCDVCIFACYSFIKLLKTADLFMGTFTVRFLLVMPTRIRC